MYNTKYISHFMSSTELGMKVIRQCCIRNKMKKSFITCTPIHALVKLELKNEELVSEVEKIATQTEETHHDRDIKTRTINSVNKYSTECKPSKESLIRRIVSRQRLEILLFGKLIKPIKNRSHTLSLLNDGTKNHELLWIQNHLKASFNKTIIQKIKKKKTKTKITSESVEASNDEKNSRSTDLSHIEEEKPADTVINPTDRQTIIIQQGSGSPVENSICGNMATNNYETCNPSDVSQSQSNVTSPDLESVSIFGSDQTDDNTQKNIESSAVQGKDGVKPTKYPSVTAILRDTMSPDAQRVLELWKQRMIKKLGKEGFDIYQKELMRDGSMLHSCIEKSLLQKEFEIPTRIEAAYKSLKDVLIEMNNVVAIETRVSHEKLRYRGIVDGVMSYRGKQCVIDWKKSDKIKATLESTYDAPIQVAAYIGAINASGAYPDKIDTGLIVVAHTSGYPAIVHEINGEILQMYWKTWLGKLQQYYSQGIYRTF